MVTIAGSILLLKKHREVFFSTNKNTLEEVRYNIENYYRNQTVKKDISLKVGDKIAISRKLTVTLNFVKPIESLKVSQSVYFHSLGYIRIKITIVKKYIVQNG